MYLKTLDVNFNTNDAVFWDDSSSSGAPEATFTVVGNSREIEQLVNYLRGATHFSPTSLSAALVPASKPEKPDPWHEVKSFNLK